MSDFFTAKLKNWVSIDNKVKNLTDQIKLLRKEKNTLNNEIIEYANRNSLTNAKIQITDGQLKFQNINQSAPLTFKFIQECLNDIIEDKNKVSEIITYIKEQRDIKTYVDIKRYYNK